jgi:hypothetical protein
MAANFEVFIRSVADSAVFWVGLFLMIEPYLEGAAPKVSAFLKEWLDPCRRKRVFRIVGLMAIFFACFQAWNVQYEANGTNQNRFAMKALLSTSIKEGEELTRNWFKRDDDTNFKHETNLWTNKTGQLVKAAYGEGEVAVWASDAGYTNHSDGKVHTEMYNWIINRLQRTNDLMEKVDSKPMQPRFDPNNYKWVTECSDC